jgi:hypothetical protein
MQQSPNQPRQATLIAMTLSRALVVACAGLVLAMLWLMSAYLDARGSLREVCARIESQPSKGIEEAQAICNEANGGR